MDWNELIRIWGAERPGEELEVEAAAENALLARSRRRTRTATGTEDAWIPERREEPRVTAVPGDGARA